MNSPVGTVPRYLLISTFKSTSRVPLRGTWYQVRKLRYGYFCAPFEWPCSQPVNRPFIFAKPELLDRRAPSQSADATEVAQVATWPHGARGRHRGCPGGSGGRDTKRVCPLALPPPPHAPPPGPPPGLVRVDRRLTRRAPPTGGALIMSLSRLEIGSISIKCVSRTSAQICY